MVRKSLFVPLMIVVLALASGPVWAGGWSVATLDSWPECVVAEDPLAIGFVVRQHGIHTLEGLTPVIVAHHEESREQLKIEAAEDTPGHYTAELVFPVDGAWTWTFTAFGPDQPMPPLAVRPAGETCPAESDSAEAGDPEAVVELGSTLFAAKGCVVCHQHDAAGFEAYASINAGPDLTTYHGDPGFLCRWLADPAALNPKTYMPDLDLSGPEIEALIMFLNGDEDSESGGAAPGWCGDVLASAAGQ